MSDAKKKLVVWGASGHALVVADIIRIGGEYEVVGFLDDISPERSGERFCGSVILGGKEQLDLLRSSGFEYIIFGFGNCPQRLELAEMVTSKGFTLAKAVHPRAVVASDVIIGAGSVVAGGAVINSGSRIGENVIINTCASVDHECVICDGAHVCPGVRLGGKVTVGRATIIGIGSTLIDRVRIGNNVIIGAGSLVLHDIADGFKAYGTPAAVKGNIGNV